MRNRTARLRRSGRPPARLVLVVAALVLMAGGSIATRADGAVAASACTGENCAAPGTPGTGAAGRGDAAGGGQGAGGASGSNGAAGSNNAAGAGGAGAGGSGGVGGSGNGGNGGSGGNGGNGGQGGNNNN